MPKEYSRIERIAGLIQHEIAEMLQREIEDPNLKDITIARVEVTRDIALAKIYVAILDEKQDIKDKLRRLNKAASFLRYRLANSIELRVTPQLKFIYDPALRDSARLFSILQAIPDTVADTEDAEEKE